jgi:N-acetylglutamate synthase-like GNAT family acetyltransferase
LEEYLVEYSIRPANEKDFPAIKRLIHAAGINPTGLNWRRFIIAETSAGQLAGCGQLKPHYDGTIELASIAVVPSARNQGLGSSLVQRLVSAASRPLYLICRQQLGDYYKKFGFLVVADDQLPKYFKRLSRIAGLVHDLHFFEEVLIVMVLE